MNDEQEISLKGLIIIDRIFKENNIQYVLLAGSCLGGVRDEGFIPWDDDIDIGIFQRDYKKLNFLLKKLPNEYTWIDYSNSNNYPRFHGKLLYRGKGVLDIFPLINISDSRFIRKIQWMTRKGTFKLYKAKLNYANSNEKKNFVSVAKVAICKVVAFFVSKKFIIKLKEWNDSLYEGKNTAYCINMYSIYSMQQEMIKREWIFPIRDISFENHRFPTLNDTDSYLGNLYGADYMIPIKYDDAKHLELFS